MRMNQSLQVQIATTSSTQLRANQAKPAMLATHATKKQTQHEWGHPHLLYGLDISHFVAVLRMQWPNLLNWYNS